MTAQPSIVRSAATKELEMPDQSALLRSFASLRMTALLIIATTAAAQQPPPQPPTHDITMVDSVPLGSAISTPLPEAQRKQLEKYDLPELAGSSQALGSQLINGELRQPLVDYFARDAKIQQRLSIFEGGLVVIDVRGSAGPIRKRLILPDDAFKSYVKAVAPLGTIRQDDLTAPKNDRI